MLPIVCGINQKENKEGFIEQIQGFDRTIVLTVLAEEEETFVWKASSTLGHMLVFTMHQIHCLCLESTSNGEKPIY